HGSGGGSSGGYGSSGGWGGSSGGGWGGSSGGGSGSSGGWGGSSGGGWGGWHGRHHHRRHGGWGSHGGWGGSSGGGYGSSGGWGGSSGGSTGGGSYFYAPEVEGKVIDPSVVPMTPAPAPAPGAETSIRRADGMLAVSVPSDAKIYVNGQSTTSTGAERQYVSRDLQTGFNYTYEVKAEVVRDGKTIEQKKSINLRAGQTAELAFDFPAADTIETALTVNVPADAKVYLSGNETKATGEKRVFRTTGLAGGKAWDNYIVRVEFEQDGQTVTQEKTISLKAGESQELTFPTEVEKVAAR
ncbi:MAG: TIGR03000 domain-containing protein, partial [Planctomycetaceae bacterium]|nr:TIGR03000 domain-containing protein [Planctomycetaceae bacterium]